MRVDVGPAAAFSCDVSRREGRHVLRVGGTLPPGWAGRLAAALAARSIAVLRGRAFRRTTLEWSAELELACPPGLDPASLDLAALVREEPPRPPAGERLEITGFHVDRTARDLEVEVHAVDRLGLLHRLLQAFALYALFPSELVLETDASGAHDLFRLQGMGASVPSPEVARAVEARLAELCRRGAGSSA